MFISNSFVNPKSVGMAASPGVPSDRIQSVTPYLGPVTPSGPETKMEVCRVCAKEGPNFIGIFSEAGKARGLPEKAKQCLPILVSSAIFSLFTATPCLFCLKAPMQKNMSNRLDLNEFCFR